MGIHLRDLGASHEPYPRNDGPDSKGSANGFFGLLPRVGLEGTLNPLTKVRERSTRSQVGAMERS